MSVLENGAAYENKTFKGIDCQGRTLDSIDFFDVIFEGCDFQNGVFDGCKFENCRFTDCDLSLVRLKDASFLEAEFSGCKMLGINWTATAKAFFSIALGNCIINDSVFADANLKDIKMIDCVARRVDFEGADLTGADCRQTDFEGANFTRTNLTKADFRNAQNYSINPEANTLKKTRFSMPEAMSLLSGLDVIID
jgi:fluoroquinolone resistance protein